MMKMSKVLDLSHYSSRVRTFLSRVRIIEKFNPKYKKASHHLPQENSHRKRRKQFETIYNLFRSEQLGHDQPVIVMQMLILPMLAHAFQNGQKLVKLGILQL